MIQKDWCLLFSEGLICGKVGFSGDGPRGGKKKKTKKNPSVALFRINSAFVEWQGINFLGGFVWLVLEGLFVLSGFVVVVGLWFFLFFF